MMHNNGVDAAAAAATASNPNNDCRGVMSQANRPYLRCRALHAWERKEEVVWISDNWKLWDLEV